MPGRRVYVVGVGMTKVTMLCKNVSLNFIDIASAGERQLLNRDDCCYRHSIKVSRMLLMVISVPVQQRVVFFT